MVDVTRIRKIIGKRKIYIIEDCAQSFGSKLHGQPVGTLGDIGCFSFYPTKNLATFGDGGAIIIRNNQIHHYLQMAKQYGEKNKYNNQFVAGHNRLS